MAEQFLHGVEVVQVDTNWHPIETVKSSVIGLIGMVPGADPVKYPLNTPLVSLCNRYQSSDFGAADKAQGCARRHLRSYRRLGRGGAGGGGHDP
jgi:phage tail sheath protein FI